MVSIQNVSKRYSLYHRPVDRLLEVLPFVPPQHGEFWALRDVSLTVQRGEILGIVGPNGSGKSTLLQIVAGILTPTSGRVLTSGRVAALLELGAGFNPEFTGRENVHLNGEILGLSPKEISHIFPAIARFAELGTYLDRPVKEYSSGMYVRLAFATAIHVHPDVLIVDEALAVGDAVFAQRCIRKLEELRDQQLTILFVSHDLGIVKRLAHRAVFMLNGKVAAQGATSDVINRYVGYVHERERASGETEQPADQIQHSSYRHGDGTSIITSATLCGAAGENLSAVLHGDWMTVRVAIRFRQDSSSPIVGLLIRNRLGIDVYGTNTRIEGRPLGSFSAGDTLTLDFNVHCLLTRQEYTVTVATQHADGSSQDWHDDVLSFTVIDDREIAGLVALPTVIRWERLPSGKNPSDTTKRWT